MSASFRPRRLENSGARVRFARLAVAAVGLVLSAPTYAQFDSGSSGADGALTFSCAPGGETIGWDAAGLDVEGDRIFHFTTVTIPADCTIVLRQANLGPEPILWLATGDVVIDGIVDLRGEAGHSNAIGSLRLPALPGPGGFAGGLGQVNGVGSATDGLGPGGGRAGQSTQAGTGGGHSGVGGKANAAQTGGAAYGTPFLRPLLGGSGGGGANNGGGGGAGGGAILIASSTEIRVDGTIDASGGGIVAGLGAGGSGGAIRLVAPIVSGTGLLTVAGGSGFSTANGSRGRLRVETNDYQYTGSTVVGSSRVVTLAPTTVLYSASDPQFPVLRITSIDGFAVNNPTGGFTPADVTINESNPVDVVVEAENVPVGTIVTVEVHNETTGTLTFDSPPLSGTEASSSATANGFIDPGFSLVTLRASFTP